MTQTEPNFYFHVDIAGHSKITLKRIKILKQQHHNWICHSLKSRAIRGTDKYARLASLLGSGPHNQ